MGDREEGAVGRGIQAARQGWGKAKQGGREEGGVDRKQADGWGKGRRGREEVRAGRGTQAAG